MPVTTVLPSSGDALLAPAGVLASDHAITFLPAEPPRLGTIVVYDRSRTSVANADRRGFPDEVEVVLPNASGNGVRRRTVAARCLPVTDAIPFLRDLDVDIAGAAAWSQVFTIGLGLIARGRLYPSVTALGWDAWRAGPLDPADRRLLAELAAAFPPDAHALSSGRSSPLRVRSSASLIQAAWDALADTLPRTAAAAVVTGATTTRSALAAVGDRPAGTPGSGPRTAFAAITPVSAADLRPWLVDAVAGLAGERGADVALRVELDPLGPTPATTPEDGDDEDDEDGKPAIAGRSPADPPAPMARAVLQLTSRAESSLVVDAADLYRSPAAVVARFGDDAESDLLRALRRAARAWSPLEPLLRERAPTGLDLDDDLLGELLADGATLLQGTGVEVLWPAEILADGLELRASVGTAPGVVVEAGFGLDTLVEFRWQATLHGELLSEEEIDQLAEAKRGLVRLRGRWVAADPALLERLKARRRQRLTAAEALGTLLAGTVDLDGEPVSVVADGPLAELAGRLAAITGAPEGELGVPARAGGRRRAPPVPDPWRDVAARDGRRRARRLPRRRHGPREDAPSDRPPPSSGRREPRADARDLPDVAARQLGARGPAFRSRERGPSPPRSRP